MESASWGERVPFFAPARRMASPRRQLSERLRVAGRNFEYTCKRRNSHIDIHEKWNYNKYVSNKLSKKHPE